MSLAYFHRQKRLGRKDMHTLYDIEFEKLSKLSISELQRMVKDGKVSDELRDKAFEVLMKKLDPQDRDTVEV
jgi:hypothetical protein